MAHSNGTSPNHAKTLRQGGSGPAIGNGNSSKAADRQAAAHNFQDRISMSWRGIQPEFIACRPREERAAEFFIAGPIRPLKTGIGFSRKRATIMDMQIAIFAMRLLELMFFVGLVGSTVVVLISFVEDGKELFGKDED
jgi:hypothetical protein